MVNFFQSKGADLKLNTKALLQAKDQATALFSDYH